MKSSVELWCRVPTAEFTRHNNCTILHDKLLCDTETLPAAVLVLIYVYLKIAWYVGTNRKGSEMQWLANHFSNGRLEVHLYPQSLNTLIHWMICRKIRRSIPSSMKVTTCKVPFSVLKEKNTLNYWNLIFNWPNFTVQIGKSCKSSRQYTSYI